jgi:hypothetical protein
MGCFWGGEAAFGVVRGVIRTKVGYTGGTTVNPTYRNIGDHTEAVELQFDPNVITYRVSGGFVFVSCLYSFFLFLFSLLLHFPRVFLCFLLFQRMRTNIRNSDLNLDFNSLLTRIFFSFLFFSFLFSSADSIVFHGQQQK